jgi:hypothetical protein
VPSPERDAGAAPIGSVPPGQRRREKVEWMRKACTIRVPCKNKTIREQWDQLATTGNGTCVTHTWCRRPHVNDEVWEIFLQGRIRQQIASRGGIPKLNESRDIDKHYKFLVLVWVWVWVWVCVCGPMRVCVCACVCTCGIRHLPNVSPSTSSIYIYMLYTYLYYIYIYILCIVSSWCIQAGSLEV